MGRKKTGVTSEQVSIFDLLGQAGSAGEQAPAGEETAAAGWGSEEATGMDLPPEPRETTGTDLSMDWGNLFDPGGSDQDVHDRSISDGLILSLTTLGRVDIEYIASITGAECRTVIETLRGSIYQNPDTWGEDFYKGWETADEYLSGNL